MKKSYYIAASVVFIIITVCIFAFVPLTYPYEVTDVIPEFSVSPLPTSKSGTVCPALCAVITDESGRILFEQNAHTRRGMASTTKIMTALLAIENSMPDRAVTIPKEACGIEGSSVYLSEGEILTMRELLYCLLLESGNDAAAAIAIELSGSTQRFAELMNERAAELGLTDTHFANPHGLSDSEHYTTAYELAVITAEAMKYPLFREIIATKSCTVGGNGSRLRYLVNHNKLLWTYPDACGVKTGYTIADGKCLVGYAERDGLGLISVTLGDTSPTMTHTSFFEFGFNNYVPVAAEGVIRTEVVLQNSPVLCSAEGYCGSSFCIPTDSEMSVEIVPCTVYAPVNTGDTVARAIYRCDGAIVYIIDLKSTSCILPDRISIYQKYFGEK